jgi:cytochrome P450
VASVAPTIREMNTYLLDYIRSRRANPGQDLTSKLLQVEVDGERLDDQEIVGFVGLLLAGHITTTAGDTAPGVILVWLTAANRDARVSPDPNRFDIHRKPNPHLTFGHGIHFCLGAPLARLEAKVALRIMLNRYRDTTVATDAPVEYRNPRLMVSVNKLALEVRAA